MFVRLCGVASALAVNLVLVRSAATFQGGAFR
jgi:hypothetical protein